MKCSIIMALLLLWGAAAPAAIRYHCIPIQGTEIASGGGAPSYVIPTNDAAYYCDFATDTNASGKFASITGGDSLVPSGDARWVDADNGVFFDGVNPDELKTDAPSGGNFDATNGTLMAWAYPMNRVHIRSVMSDGFQGDSRLWIVDGYSAKPPTYPVPLNVTINGGSIPIAYHDHDVFGLALEQWHHVAITKSNTVGSLYIDGELATNITAVAGLWDSHGVWGAKSPSSETTWHGFLDEVAAYERAWTAAELQEYVAATDHLDPTWSGASVADENPVLQYKFATSLLDEYDRIVNSGSHQVHGVKDYATDLPSYHVSEEAAAVTNQLFCSQWCGTIETNQSYLFAFWVNVPGYLTSKTSFGFVGSDASIIRAWWAAGGVYLYADTPHGPGVNGTTMWPAYDTWTHCAWLRHAGDDKVYGYKDGVLVGTVTDTTVGAFDFSYSSCQVGGYGGYRMTGLLDDFRFYLSDDPEGISTNLATTIYNETRQ